MNLYALLPLTGFVANFLLAVAILTRNPRARANRLYSMLCLSIGYWSLLKFARLLAGDAESALLLFKVSAVGWCMLPSLFLHFVLVFTNDGKLFHPRFAYTAHGVGAGFAGMAFLPDAMVEGMVPTAYGFAHDPGPLYGVFTVFLVGLFLLGVVLLARAARGARRATMRTQCGFIIAGVLIPLVGGVITNMILPLFGFHVLELGEVLSTAQVGIIAYAMLRHDLLGVSLEDAAETIISTMGDALLVINKRGEIVLTNSATEKMFGIGPRELVGQPVDKFVSSGVLSAARAGLIGDGLLIQEAEFVPPNAEPVPVMLSASPVRDADGNLTGIVCVGKDVRELRRMMVDLEHANKQLERQAITDDLTGAANRRYANKRLDEELKSAARYGRSLSVGILDLDDFKEVNDRFGHQAGDRVLQIVAGVLSTNVRGSDVVSRWGGDEFFLILRELDEEAAALLGERIVEGIEEVVVPGVDVPVRASLGLATLNPEEPMPAEDLIRDADIALYRAKRAGKGRLRSAHAEPAERSFPTPPPN